MTKIAHREEVKTHFSSSSLILLYVFSLQNSIVVDLDDLSQFNPDLSETVQANARTYMKLISDIVFEMLPSLKDRDVRNFASNFILFGK
jgi:DNA replicative helicase MCM subunit Mcm2 (Cdc46/Mcm family)